MRRWVNILLLFLPSLAAAQVPTPTGYLASVDSATQKIVLTWDMSADPRAARYLICTGDNSDFCLAYDTVEGCTNTRYVCEDHDPLTTHFYGLWVEDSSGDVSAMTPSFGNMVLTAVVPECKTDVQASWTPYIGMPVGNPQYTLWVRTEPSDDDYTAFYRTSDANALHHAFEISDEDIAVSLRVEAEGLGGYHSWSNIVHVTRRTVEHADFVEISAIEYDSINTQIKIHCRLDNSFAADHYTLYRSIDGTPNQEIGVFSTQGDTYTYVDRDINPFDSLFCYQLEVLDACGMNGKYSSWECVVVPDPPPPAIAFPNAIVAGDEENGTFLPKIRGLMGDLYELSIFNRQGLLVYRTEKQNEGWTPSPDIPQGTYAYHLRCRYNTGDIKNYSGTVTYIK